MPKPSLNHPWNVRTREQAAKAADQRRRNGKSSRLQEQRSLFISVEQETEVDKKIKEFFK